MGLGVARALALGNSRVYMGLQGYAVYKSIQEITGVQKGIQGITKVFKGLQKITTACKGIKKVYKELQ